MPTVVKCPNCGRPNGNRFPKCMYCSTDLPKTEEVQGEADEAKAEPSSQALDPALMESLPPGLRSQFGAMSARKGASPPATATPPPTPAVQPRTRVEVPKSLLDDLQTLDEDLTPLPDTVSYDETLDGLAVQSLVAELDQDDPTSLPDPVNLDEPLDLEPLPISSIQEQYIPSTERPGPLLRGRGPWGPRSAEARLLLLPDPSYRHRLPWLRARLNNLLGLDAYTANLYLQRTFPVFLAHYDDRAQADEVAAELDRGGMGVLVLTRAMVMAHPRAVVVAGAVVEDELVLFSVDGEPEQLLSVPRDAIEAAFTGEIKPAESPDQPLVERSFWRNKPRPSLSFEEIGNPYWILDMVTPSAIVRVRSDAFDFDCLGEDRGPSSLFNLRTLPAALSSDELVADDLFKRVPRVKHEASSEAAADPDQPAGEVTLFDEYVMIQTVTRRHLTRRG